MSNIIQVAPCSAEIDFVKKALIGLRKCYPGFASWYDTKVVPEIDKSRKIFLATSEGEFSGALILKATKQEKKVCTLFVNENVRHKGLGTDLMRIASEELETYKLPITISSEATPYFFNSNKFNFFTKDVKTGIYNPDYIEYIGYLMYRNPDEDLRK